jgi:hypothetical protein
MKMVALLRIKLDPPELLAIFEKRGRHPLTVGRNADGNAHLCHQDLPLDDRASR